MTSFKDFQIEEIDGGYIAVKGSKTFGIKEDLKKHGARWEGTQRFWYFEASKKSVEDVQKIVKDIVGEETDEDYEPPKRTEPPKSYKKAEKRDVSKDKSYAPYPESKASRLTYDKVKGVISESKDLWMSLISKLGENKKPNPCLHNAAVRLKYQSESEFILRFHSVIVFRDEFYRDAANKVSDFLIGKGYQSYVSKGQTDYQEF